MWTLKDPRNPFTEIERCHSLALFLKANSCWIFFSLFNLNNFMINAITQLETPFDKFRFKTKLHFFKTRMNEKLSECSNTKICQNCIH